ncbi:MAG: hypothetical protein L3K14_03120 [Thermoplasmata archaeon]|nr:hypothetical protein [Thermoplasmata archaeon]
MAYLSAHGTGGATALGDKKARNPAAAKVPALAPSFAEHQRRQAQHPREQSLPLESHVRALRRSGFRTVAVVWQIIDNRVLFAQR